MKIAIVYNSRAGEVVNPVGTPNAELIRMTTIERIVDALEARGHQVLAMEGDKKLFKRLEEFLPTEVKGERPGFVFNLSYGVQGEARYTHVPAILELLGYRYLGSSPTGHAVCLDKGITKTILREHDLSTPEFATLDTPDAEMPELTYPLMVKPISESVSFGLKTVHDETELRAQVKVIYDKFRQPVLAERKIRGREFNVGLIGNDPPDVFQPVELIIGDGNPDAVYGYEDKVGKSGRPIRHECPANIDDALAAEAKELARRAFTVLGCRDYARVDLRLDIEDNKLHILELNSHPSLGEHGSYLVGAEHAGLDFAGCVNKLVDVAMARHPGTPSPPPTRRWALWRTRRTDPSEHVSSFIADRRDEMEDRLADWVKLDSRTGDAVGQQTGFQRLSGLFEELGMREVPELTRAREVATWQTKAGLDDGVLLIGHLDVPLTHEFPPQPFHKTSEWLHGEGVGSSRAPLVMLEYALTSLYEMLPRIPLGVLYYADEGNGARHSKDEIIAAATRAREVLVLRPSPRADAVVTARLGRRRFKLRVDAESLPLGTTFNPQSALRWTWQRLEEIAGLSSEAEEIQVATTDLQAKRHVLCLPHQVTAEIMETYPTPATGDTTEGRLHDILGRGGEGGPQYQLVTETERPPFVGRRAGDKLAGELAEVASGLKIALERESKVVVWPSVAGLVPADKACVCGVGPMARDLRTPRERVQRLSLAQRALLLAHFLESRRRGGDSR